MQRRVLFVDDEPSIRGIYQMLGDFLGADYAVSTVGGPGEAQASMAEQPAHVIVSDLVMPGISGAELLLDVSRRYPASGRIAVSGFADQITMAKCLTVAHRYFSKPFHPVALTKAIEELQATSMSAPGLFRELAGRIQTLPVPSETYLLLTKALNSHSVSLDSIAVVVEKDPSLSSKLLQAANSAMFGSRGRCCRIADAIQILGLEAIRTLLLSIQVFDLCPGKKLKPFLERLWKHSLEVSRAAKHLAHLQGLPAAEIELAFLGGLLHDIGKVVLAASSPEAYGALVERFSSQGQAFREAEVAAFGADHAKAGAYLLKLWGLPEGIIHIIEQHHSPFESIKSENLLLTVKAAHELSASSTPQEFERWRNETTVKNDKARQEVTPPAHQTPSALVASADLFEAERLGAVLRASGYLLFSAASQREAFKMLHDLAFHVAIVDETFLPADPAEAWRAFRQINGTARLLLLRRGKAESASHLKLPAGAAVPEMLAFGAGAHELVRKFRTL
jgi:putative nucleotidyltransferase with HDIG domain